MVNLLYILPLIAGFLACVQGTINGYWQAKVGLHATVLINGAIVAAAALFFFLFANQTSLRLIGSQLRPWIAFNGLCGFSIVAIAAFTFPRIGAASVVVLMVSGQIFMSLFADHLGVLNLPQHAISPTRLLGAVLVIIGVLLTTRS